MDQESDQFFRDFPLPGIKLLSLSQIETPDLLEIKKSRTHGEYCWTLTPFLVSQVLRDAPKDSTVTYIDADCWLAGPVDPLMNAFEESGADCMITPHFFPEGSNLSSAAGTYCVQFMPFKANPNSRQILGLWAKRCLQSCSSISNGSGLGDQAHLEDWPSLFGDSVFVLDRPHLTLAPWNIEHLCISPESRLCLYHFQGFRLFQVWSFLIVRASARVELPRFLIDSLLGRYVHDVREALRLIPSHLLAIKRLPPPWSDLRGYFLLAPRLLFLKWKVFVFLLPKRLNSI